MKGKTRQTGRDCWLFICAHVESILPRVATKSQIKQAAAVVFQVGPDFPESRLDEAQRQRCGAQTLRAFQDRARELNLPEPDGLNESANGDRERDLIGQLETEIERRAARYRDRRHPQVEALQDAVNALRVRV